MWVILDSILSGFMMSGSGVHKPSSKRWLLCFWDICLSIPTPWKSSSMAEKIRTGMFSWVKSGISSSFCIFESWKRDTKMWPFVQSSIVTELVQGFQGASFVFHIYGLVCIFVWSLILKDFQFFSRTLYWTGNGKSQCPSGKQTNLALWYLRIKSSLIFVVCWIEN